MVFSARPTRMHCACVLGEILFPFACVTTLVARNRFVVDMAQFVSIESSSVCELLPACLACVWATGMLLANMQVIG